MSLVATRLNLRHRVTIERHTATSDGGGGSTETWATHAEDVPCRAWAEPRRNTELEQGAKVTTIADRRLLVPLGTDVTEQDRIGDVTDAAGATVFEGPMLIDAVARNRTHIELLVTEMT